MQRCPNCSYQLVLLSHRPKYKCAFCSNLYSQKEIDFKDFQEWNINQRQIDKQNIIPLKQPIKRIDKEKRLLKGFRLLFNEKKHRIKLTIEQKRIKTKGY